MKYIKEYKIFESISDDDIIQDIHDIFVELEDNDFSISVEKEIPPLIHSSLPKNNKPTKYRIRIKKIDAEGTEPTFLTSLLSEYLIRLKDYLKQNKIPTSNTFGLHAAEISFAQGRWYTNGYDRFVFNSIKYKVEVSTVSILVG